MAAQTSQRRGDQRSPTARESRKRKRTIAPATHSPTPTGAPSGAVRLARVMPKGPWRRLVAAAYWGRARVKRTRNRVAGGDSDEKLARRLRAVSSSFPLKKKR